MRGVVRVIWGKCEAEYFGPQDWTGQIKLKSLDKFAHPRTCRAAVTVRETSGPLPQLRPTYWQQAAPTRQCQPGCCIRARVCANSSSRLSIWERVIAKS